MPPPAEAARLIERFEQQRDDYRWGRYNEAQLRTDFLNPFFAELGWDVHNREGRAEAWREVLHEYGIRVRGVTRTVDYCFRIGREPIFLVEAKKPARVKSGTAEVDAAFLAGIDSRGGSMP